MTRDYPYSNLLRNFMLIVLALISVCSESKAKDNPYSVDNDYYQQFLDLQGIANTERGVALADSTARAAKSYGDLNAACMFLSIPAKYYLRHNDSKKLDMVCDRIRNMTRDGDSVAQHWYFWSYHQQALNMINNNQLFSALDIASKMHEEAEELNSRYGILETMIVIGDIYRIRNDIGLSGENYLNAYEYSKLYLPDVNVARLCAYLGEYYRRKSGRNKDDIEKSKEFVELGLSMANTDHDKALLLSEKAMSLYSERNIPAFYSIYKECEDIYGRIGEDPEFLQIKYRKCILDKDYKSATSIANSLPNDYDREIALYVIARATNNYEDALKYYEKANHALNLIREQERRGDLSEINARMGNYQLEIANSTLEHERAQAINTALIVICVLIIVVLVALIAFIRKMNRTNRQLEENNQALIEARKQAEESDKMKIKFIQNMSHEIRTPLNAIVGFSNLLAYNDNEFSRKELDEFCRLINHNCDMLTVLIDDVLTISDLESGKYLFDFSETLVNQTCQMALESARIRTKQGVTLNFVSHIDDRHSVTTDSIRLTQVINNVLMNACKFTESGSITIETRVKDDKLQISIADTGPGIPEGKAHEIFERFTKLNHFKQGTGLGLSICKMIMERLHGSIYIDTSYRHGAKFVIEIPDR